MANNQYFILALFLSLCTAITSLNSQALPFSIGPVEGEFESIFSIKNSWATSKPDHHLIGSNNGGRGFSQTSDNGRLNFKQGDSFSRLLKGKHNLHLKYQQYGLMLSGQYWYDFVEKNQRQPFKNINDHGQYMSSRAAGAEWLDAFVYHHYQLAGKQGTVRIGRQRLNWGEERFIDGGINIINPIDRREGWRPDMDTRAERTPVSLISFSQQLTNTVSTEFFYQLDWRPTTFSPCNSFFAMNDYTSHGCTSNLRVLTPYNKLSQAELNTLPRVNINNEGVLVKREKDQRAKTSGQFGITFNSYFEPIKTDLAFYFINYHSRTGFINGRMASRKNISQVTSLASLAPEWLAGHSSYFIKYPENIRLYGLSFSKDINADLTWRGELSYRPNLPIQINPITLFKTATTNPSINLASQQIKGYKRKPATQFQTSLTRSAYNIMGAQTFNLTSALGVSYVGNLDTKTLYGRDAVFGSGYDCAVASRYCEKQGFTTRFAWGYRLRGEWQYQNILSPRLTLKPNISWLHDVQGYSPSNEASFIKGRKAISLGVNAEYLRTYYIDLNYTNFFGGRYNTWVDRDFLSLEAGLKF